MGDARWVVFGVGPINVENMFDAELKLEADFETFFARVIVQNTCVAQAAFAGNFHPHPLATVLLDIPKVLEAEFDKVANIDGDAFLAVWNEEGIGRLRRCIIGVA